MTLDQLASLASIITPFILAILGWVIPKRIAEIEKRKIATKEFHAGWNKIFSDTVLEYVDTISEFSSIWNEASTSNDPQKIIDEELRPQLGILLRLGHRASVYAHAVEGTDEVVVAMKNANKWINNSLSNKGGNFDELSSIQKDILSNLRIWKRIQTGI